MVAWLQARRTETAAAREVLARVCSATCADIEAVGGGANFVYDCSDDINNLTASPAAMSCAAPMCSAVECCTVVPPAAANSQFRQALMDAPLKQDWRKVSTSITFDADITDIPVGSAERAEFEQKFKETVAALLGDGETVTADMIVIDNILAASIIVEWHLLVPPEAAVTAFSLLQSLKDSSTTIEIVVGGVAMTATTTSMTTPLAVAEERVHTAATLNETAALLVADPTADDGSSSSSAVVIAMGAVILVGSLSFLVRRSRRRAKV